MMSSSVKKFLNVAVVLALAGTVGACSSGGSAKAGAAASSPSTSASATWSEYAKCMRDHGIDMPDPQPGGQITFGGRAKSDPGTLNAAMTACRSLLPGGKGSGSLSAADQQREVQKAQCLRDHGVQVQDPQPGQQLTITGAHADPATLRAAIAACRSSS